MATNAQIRRAVADAINDLASLNVYRYPPDSVSVPAAIVAGLDIDFASFTGGRETSVAVLVIVSRSHTSQLELLDELLDPAASTSVVAAIESRVDADDVSLMVESVGGYGEIEWGGVSYYGALVTVKALT
jgi:hypothetical protein